MKSLTRIICSIIFLVPSISFSQYFEKSEYLSFLTEGGPAWGLSHGTTTVDRKGNIFHKYGSDFCMGCNMWFYFKKSNLYDPAVSWSYFFNYDDVTVSGFEDQNANTYMLVQTSYTYVINGTTYNMSGGYDYALFKYNQSNVLQWIIDCENGTTYSDMSDNIYIMNNNKLMRKYSSAGLLVDSSQFTTATAPAFMDSLGSFYRLNSGTLIQFDFTGNINWQLPVSASSVYYDMQGPYMYAYNSSSIYEIDLSGNIFHTYSNASSFASGLKFDLKGCYYFGPGNKYSLTGGLVYSKNIPGFSGSNAMDCTGRFYSFGYYETYTHPLGSGSTSANFLFLAPSVYWNPHPPIGTYYDTDFNWVQVVNTEHKFQSVNFTLPPLQYNFCMGTDNTQPFEFEVDRYPVGSINSGFTVQLLNANRNVAPIVLGTGNHSPISITIPNSVQPGNHYAVRIIPNDTSFSSTNNIIPNVTVYQAPQAIINYSNCYKNSQYNNVYGCDSIYFYATINPFNAAYKWEKVIDNYGNWPPITYQTKGTNSSYWFKDNSWYGIKLTVMDGAGCLGTSTMSYPKIIPNLTFTMTLPDSINQGNNPLSVYTTLNNYQIDSIYGNFVHRIGGTYKFYPDSAGPGIHYIYAKIPSQCVFGAPNCLPDSIVDSILVTSPFTYDVESKYTNSFYEKNHNYIIRIYKSENKLLAGFNEETFIGEAELYDLSGRKISITMGKQIDGYHAEFNLPVLSAGAYILSVKTNKREIKKMFFVN